MSARTVLITGGAGFIGTHLATRLAADGDEVTLVDSLHPQVHPGGWPSGLPAGVQTWPFDVTGASQWDALFKMLRPDVVVHLAAETGTGQSLTEASRHSRVNVVGTTELLDGLSRADHVPGRLVLASSRAVYGEGVWSVDGAEFYAAPRGRAQLERGQWDPVSGRGAVVPRAQQAGVVEPRPSNVYAATKLAQEHILGAWALAHGAPLTVCRLQNVYGPGQSLTNPYTGIVSLFAQLALDRKPIPVYEDGRITRDFVFVGDVVAALRSAARTDDLAPSGVTTVDIGFGQPGTLLELAGELARQAGGPLPTVTGAFRHGDVRAAYADVSAARRVLGFTPEVSPAAGTRLLLDWIREQEPASRLKTAA